MHYLEESIWVSIKVSLKFFSKGPINNILALVQIMAWRLVGAKPSSEPIMASLSTHAWVTRPQLVKTVAEGKNLLIEQKSFLCCISFCCICKTNAKCVLDNVYTYFRIKINLRIEKDQIFYFGYFMSIHSVQCPDLAQKKKRKPCIRWLRRLLHRVQQQVPFILIETPSVGT